MLKFMDWYESFTSNGETMLVVQQIPKKQDGEFVYHGDGALACTWPAFLPSKKFKDGAAIYGNTAVFIIDRFKDGKPSASGANCEHVAFMVLDDIGTVAKRPPIEPSWKMQTSEGSQQWGYAFDFDHQPKKGDFSAAIIAIAEAGYTDKGAINPVRNFRLPGSVNLKPNKNGFQSKLIEWNQDRFFTLPDICKALGVTPEAADTAQHRSVQLVDTGNDSVVKWLDEQALVLERPNSSGWMGVVCPNAEEHSDGNPMGRYNPVHRSFCCLHSHCQDWTSDRFLRWVEEEGGPSVQTGIRDDLLSDTMTKVMSILEPQRAEQGSQFSPEQDAEVEVARSDTRDLSRLSVAEWFTRYGYLQRDDAYFDGQACTVVSRRAFDALYRHIDCKSMHGKNPKVSASIKFDERRNELGAPSLESLTYAPGDGSFLWRNGAKFGNLWRNSRPVGKAGDVSKWLGLLERLVPEKLEREHILNVLAHKVQHPGIKINHALLIAGGHGIGKDTLLAPFLYAVGGQHHDNTTIVRNEEIGSKWGYTLENEVIIYNELRQSEAKDRRALENHLKPVIAAPPDMLTVERKGMHPYQIPNRCLVVAYSNERAAIAIPREDRRWFVVWSAAEKMPDPEAKVIWDWYKSGGFDAIAAWLQVRDVSAFNPAAAPPMTEAKVTMILDARSSAEEYLEDMLKNRSGPFEVGVIAAPLHKLVDQLQQGFPGGRIVLGALLHALREVGWADLGRIHSYKNNTHKRMFCAPEVLLTHSKTDLRDMVEEIVPVAAASPLRVVR